MVQVSGGKEEERRWRDPKWAPAINIMPCDLPHIMVMIIYTSACMNTVCYDSNAIIALLSHHMNTKERRRFLGTKKVS